MPKPFSARFSSRIPALAAGALSSLLLSCGTQSLAQGKPAPIGERFAPVSKEALRSLKEVEAVIARRKKAAAIAQAKVDALYAAQVKAAKKAGIRPPAEPEEQEDATEYLESYRYYFEQRAYPGDTLDWKAMNQAAEDRDAMDAYKGIAARINGGGARGAIRNDRPGFVPGDVPMPPTVWQFIGPRNLPVPYQIYYGPLTSRTSGRINGIAYHPTDSNIAYLASGGGGVWKTTNGGANWTSVGLDFPTQFIGAIAVDPTNGNTVYAGLGDYDGSLGATGGVMKSTDGGTTWTRMDAGNTLLNSSRVSAIAIDPDNTSRLVLTAGRVNNNGNVFLSTNGGASWTARSTPEFYWSDVEISPVKTGATGINPNTRFYYATLEDGSTLHRSADGGVTWTTIPGGGWSNQDYVEMATSAVDPNVVYVSATAVRTIYTGTRDPATDTYTWVTNVAGFPNGNSSVGTTYNWSQGFYDHNLLAVPQTVSGSVADVLFSSLITVAGKRGANPWQDIGVTYTSSAATHNDQHSFTAFPADKTKMLFGNDGGVYGMTYDPAAGTFSINSQLSGTLGVTMLYHSDFHPTNPLWAIGGAQDNATPVLRGDALNWLNRGQGDGGGSQISPINPNRQYLTSQNGGFFYTNDAWNTSSSLSVPSDGVFVGRIVIDPNYPNPVYYCGNSYVHRFNHAAAGTGSWEARLGTYSFGSQVQSLAVAPSSSKIIFAGASGRLARSMDYGVSWTAIQGTLLPNKVYTDISVNPTNANDVIVTLSGTGTAHVYRSTDALSVTPTWTSMSGTGTGTLPDTPTNTVTRDPFDATGNTFFVGTDIGVFATANGGSTWTNATVPLGLPNTQVTTLRAMPKTGYLMAGTYGRGMWRIPLTASIPDLKPTLYVQVSSLARSGGNIRFTINISNMGGTNATATSLTTMRFTAGTNTTNATVPISVGTITPGASVAVTVSLPAGVIPANTAGYLTLKGTYTFGSQTGTFGGTSAATAQ